MLSLRVCDPHHESPATLTPAETHFLLQHWGYSAVPLHSSFLGLQDALGKTLDQSVVVICLQIPHQQAIFCLQAGEPLRVHPRWAVTPPTIPALWDEVGLSSS